VAGIGCGTSTHVKPFPQSVAVSQVWARASGARATRAVIAPTARRILVNDMGISVAR
jgi:hypothetical protein